MSVTLAILSGDTSVNIDGSDENADWIKPVYLHDLTNANNTIRMRINLMDQQNFHKATRLAIMALLRLQGQELTPEQFCNLFSVDRSQFTRDKPDIDLVVQQIQALLNSVALAQLIPKPKATVSSSDRTVWRCNECGATWWEPYQEKIWTGTFQDESDRLGNHYPILGEVDVPGKNEWHLSTCSLHYEG